MGRKKALRINIGGDENPASQVWRVWTQADLLPKNKTMTLMRFPTNLTGWRSQHEETLHRRTNHQSYQRA